MPIRPENRERYPADWKAISAAIKARAGNRCECEGECGRGTHEGVIRDDADIDDLRIKRCSVLAGGELSVQITEVTR